MQLALDPYEFRRVPLLELPAVVAELGYEYTELSPREEFIPFFAAPRAGSGEVSAFKASLADAGRSESRLWLSMEELLPIFDREGTQLRLEPHPDDFIEDGGRAVDSLRGINSPNVSFLYCAPHTFHMAATSPPL